MNPPNYKSWISLINKKLPCRPTELVTMMSRKSKKEQNYENAVADLKRFRDIGDDFEYMDTKFNVTGHFVTQTVDGEQRKIPMIRAAYIDKNGVHQSRQFPFSMLRVLYNTNKETVPGDPIGEPVDVSPMKSTKKLLADEPLESKTQIVRAPVLDKKVDTSADTKPFNPPATVVLDKPSKPQSLEEQERYTYVDVKAAYHSGYEFAMSLLKAQNPDVGYARFMAKMTGKKKP